MKQILLRGFILVFLCFQLSLSYHNFNELKQDMEARVQRIANALQDIYSTRCQVGTFQCPVKSFNMCQGTDQRSCITSFPTAISCDGITRYSMTSGVRFPNSVVSFNLSDQTKFFLCKTAQPLFQKVHKQLIEQNGKRYAWLGVASHTGAIRVSPGFKTEKQKQTESCKNFDPRLRPWYASNAYQRKKMVIVIQNSRPIHSQPNRYPSIQKSLKALLKTAEPSDLFNIVQFSSEARVLFGGQSMKLVSLDQEIKRFNEMSNNQGDFFESVAGNITKSNSSDANYQKAIMMAVQILQNSRDINPEMENMILMFTGFKPTNCSKTIAKQMTEYMKKKQKELDMNFLFFGFGVNLADQQGIVLLSNLACEFDGIFIQLPDITYQSMFLDSAEGFYDYLTQGNQVKGYRWTDFYEDAFGLGRMVSVVRLIYHKDKTITKLIGAALMDVLISQLRVYKTLEQIQQELSTTQIPFIKNISLCTLETIRKKHRCFDPSISMCSTQPPCSPNIASNESVIRSPIDSSDLQCCFFQTKNSTGLILGLSIGISGVILIIALLLYCLIFKNRDKNILQKTYAEIFQKFKDFDQTRIRSESQISFIKE